MNRMMVPVILGVLMASGSLRAAEPVAPTVDLQESLRPSVIKSATEGMVLIAGKAAVTDGAVVRVRVTTSYGDVHESRPTAVDGRYSCRYPQDFTAAPVLAPMALYVDVTDRADFGGEAVAVHQAEAVLIIAGAKGSPPPDFPQVFTDDFIDAVGKRDAEAAQFSRNRTLANLFVRSRAARLMHIQNPGFDLAHPADFAWFKEHATLYDFDHRERDWTTPLGNRVARGFWQAMWNTWFNPTNDHPWDGNPANQAQENFRPYTFANDPADLAILYVQLREARPAVADQRIALTRDVMENILAMQHRTADNFSLLGKSGKRQIHTAGSFHYGMFETGEWLSEGTGWFANPIFRDFEYGGVFNGRCVWAMGEFLRAEPTGPLAARIRDAMSLTLRFCLHDGLEHRYTRLTTSGLPLWGYPGEHAYLLLGMLAATVVVPELPVVLTADAPPRTLRALCRDALNALAESVDADGTWTDYPNVNAINIIALAEGALQFAGDPEALRWRSAAIRAADHWIALRPLPSERKAPTPLFGQRKDGGMTYYLGKGGLPHVTLYVNGHWLHALAVLHRLTHEQRYRERAEAIASYYCGANPLHVRLLSELGSVNNRVTDSDRDGIEDHLGWDAYPESTAFFQIGLLQLIK